MITEQDLQAAIAECQGKRNADANTCLKLAAFYTIKDHLYPEAVEAPKSMPRSEFKGYSYASGLPSDKSTIGRYGDTEFSHSIEGRDADEIWPIIVELMEVLNATNPRLYTGVMRKIEA